MSLNLYYVAGAILIALVVWFVALPYWRKRRSP